MPSSHAHFPVICNLMRQGSELEETLLHIHVTVIRRRVILDLSADVPHHGVLCHRVPTFIARAGEEVHGVDLEGILVRKEKAPEIVV